MFNSTIPLLGITILGFWPGCSSFGLCAGR